MRIKTTLNTVAAAAAFAIVVTAMSACASKKAALAGGDGTVTQTGTRTGGNASEEESLAFVGKVADNAVDVTNITAKIDFMLKTGTKDLSVDGSIRMRKDEVIRIQLSPFGLMEVGRIELTPEYVLIIDRIHKEYIKADYNRVAFLQRNGLDFYTLQALFWNKLFMPGQHDVTRSTLGNYRADTAAGSANIPVRLDNGDLKFRWDADRQTGRINTAIIKYTSATAGTSMVNWKYDSFKQLGTKSFPATQTITLNTQALQKGNGASVTIKMGGVSTKADWEAHTEVSAKYKQVSVEEVLKKIVSL